MNIQVTISLGAEDDAQNLPGNATKIAADFLTALTASGGDPEKDTCTVNIQDYGTAGSSTTTGPGMPPPPMVR